MRDERDERDGGRGAAALPSGGGGRGAWLAAAWLVLAAGLLAVSAATVTPNASADYVFTSPSPAATNQIVGLGMGAAGDYETLRSEDAAWLGEAAVERAWFGSANGTGGFVGFGQTFDGLSPSRLRFEAALDVLRDEIADGRLVSSARAETARTAAARAGGAQDALAGTNRWEGFVRFEALDVPHALSKTNVQHWGYGNVAAGTHALVERGDARTSGGFERRSDEVPRWLERSYDGEKWRSWSGGEDASWTNAAAGAALGSVSCEAGAIYHKVTYSGFGTNQVYAGSQNGWSWMEWEDEIAGEATVRLAVTNGEEVVGVSAWGLVRWSHVREESGWDGSWRSTDLGSGLFVVPMAASASGGVVTLTVAGASIRDAVLGVTGQSIPLAGALSRIVTQPPPRTEREPGDVGYTVARDSYARETASFRIEGVALLAEMRWRTRETGE